MYIRPDRVAAVSERELFRQAADYAADFVETLDTRSVRPEADVEELIAALGGQLPELGLDPQAVIASLVEAAEPGVVANASGRYFGFVVGGGVTAALTADWLASAWDQNAAFYVMGPSAAVGEEVCRGWLAELLGLPLGVSGAFVTGCQMAHVTALAAARHHVLAQAGWDVARDGLAGSPPIQVVVGEQRHVTIDRALRLLGIGSSSLVVLPADDEGRMRVDELRLTAAPTIVCGQAGEVNTGAFDDFHAIADACGETGAWFHVDGAFGLWAAVSPELRHLVAGLERADSWTTDAHKWLNVPYDSGIVFCAHPESHRAAMSVSASYLIQHEGEQRVRDQVGWVPEFSRRARGFAVYAALRSLGRSGVTAIVERCCDGAARFAERIVELPGVELLNEVVLNQVLFRFESDERTDDVLRRVQDGGRVWMSGTTWDGRKAIRLSVSNWQTGDEEIDLAVAAFQTAA